MSTNVPRTPLRRVSQGSLRALSRSGSSSEAPACLGFLEPALAELADEAESLQGNAQRLHDLSNSLQLFNDSFAAYLYAMQMNALTTDWVQAPTETSYALAKKRADDDARAAETALRAAAEAAAEAERAAAMEEAEVDDGLFANDTTMASVSSAIPVSKLRRPTGILKNAGSSGIPKKAKPKPKLSPKERRERSLYIDKVVSNLPLEYRGQDPTLRKNVEAVIETMIDNPTGLEIQQIIKPPELNQARANKCLLALLNRKIVSKETGSGRAVYTWNGIPD